MMDYRIKPIGKLCAATGLPLEAGETVHSVVVERHGELERLDFSQSGWAGPPEGTLGYWRTTMAPEKATEHKPLDANELLEHFQQLIEDANPAQERSCYVLALLLLQKRRLTLDGSRVDGDMAYLILSGSKGEGPFEIRDQQLSGDEIRALQAQLKQQFKAAA